MSKIIIFGVSQWAELAHFYLAHDSPHDVVMGSAERLGQHMVGDHHVMSTSQVVISGCCTIEPFCIFGVNATVRDETVIARDTLVGMGVTILKDTKGFQVYKAAATEPTGFRSDQIRSLSHKSKG